LIETDHAGFSLDKDTTRLLFRTASFAPDRGSVLHSGIYNREFSSVLASFALAGLAYFLLVLNFGREVFFYAVFMVLFIAAFPLFRRYVFRERYLEALFDRATAVAEIRLYGIRTRSLERMPLGRIAGIRIETTKSEVLNRDGAEFVEKISAQHGTVIPGFGEEKTFYSLILKYAEGGERTLFAGRSMQDVIFVYDEIKEFLKI
jgi:hypothetical protein